MLIHIRIGSAAFHLFPDKNRKWWPLFFFTDSLSLLTNSLHSPLLNSIPSHSLIFFLLSLLLLVFEIMPMFARNIICGFARMNGRTVGVRTILTSFIIPRNIALYPILAYYLSLHCPVFEGTVFNQSISSSILLYSIRLFQLRFNN